MYLFDEDYLEDQVAEELDKVSGIDCFDISGNISDLAAFRAELTLKAYCSINKDIQ